MTNPVTWTTEDVDRLLGLADQFLDDWAEDAVQAGQPDAEYEARGREDEAHDLIHDFCRLLIYSHQLWQSALRSAFVNSNVAAKR